MMAISTTDESAAPRKSPAAQRPARRPARNRRRRYDWLAYAFIAPTGLGLAILYMWPAIQTFWFSFTSWGPFGGNTWIGVQNYRDLFASATFWQTLGNSLLYTVLGLVTIPIALLLAALLNKPGLRGVSVYRALYFLPFVTLTAAVGLMWGWLYNGDYGAINQILRTFGLTGTYWVSNPRTTVIAIGMVIIWSQIGYYLIILTAGIKSIPRDFYEAAQLDGAGPIRQFFSITVPLISPSLFFSSVICVIQSLQVFDLIYVMMDERNPAFGSAQSVVGLFYQLAFQQNDRGMAAALAFVLLLLIAALTIVQFRLQRRWVTYG